MISARYAVPIALLLALALVPTGIHTYWGSVATDGLTTGTIPAVLLGMKSTATARKAAWVKNNLDSDDWIERVYRGQGQDVILFAGRSYDAKRLYHHPELALMRGTETAPAGVTRATARPDVPLHMLTTAKDNRKGVAVYALLYDRRFIESPIAFQLKTSAELLVTGRRPMTLFLASDLSGDPSRIDEAPATRVLLAAIASFESQSR
jgi:hypothetical protein